MEHLAELLESERSWLAAHIGRRAGWLRRHETIEDLVQGVHLRAIENAGGFECRGPEAFRGWLRLVCDRYLVARARYWRARKRDAGRMLRVAIADPASGVAAAIEPSADWTGPATFTMRRELLELAARAAASLTARDRDLVAWRREGRSLDEIAAATGLERGAAQRAAHRAQERFARAFRFLAGAEAG